MSLHFSDGYGCEGEGDRREDKMAIVAIYIGAVEGLYISTRTKLYYFVHC